MTLQSCKNWRDKNREHYREIERERHNFTNCKKRAIKHCIEEVITNITKEMKSK